MPINNCNPTITTTTTTTTPSNNRRGEQLTRIPLSLPSSPFSSLPASFERLRPLEWSKRRKIARFRPESRMKALVLDTRVPTETTKHKTKIFQYATAAYMPAPSPSSDLHGALLTVCQTVLCCDIQRRVKTRHRSSRVDSISFKRWCTA